MIGLVLAAKAGLTVAVMLMGQAGQARA